MKNYFTYSELIKTDTGLSNSPGPCYENNKIKLLFFLNILRSELGLPIIINSAYRSPIVNKTVGGAKDSKHLQFLAADIKCSKMSKLNSILRYYKNIGVLDELIEYPTFTHFAL